MAAISPTAPKHLHGTQNYIHIYYTFIHQRKSHDISGKSIFQNYLELLFPTHGGATHFAKKNVEKKETSVHFFSGNHHCLLWGTVKTPTLLLVPPGSFLIFWLPQKCYRWGLVRSHAFFALGCRWRMLIDDTKNHLTFLKAVTRCDCFNERNWKVHFWAVVCPSFSQSSFWEDSVHSPLSASTQTNGSCFAHYPLPAEMTPSFNHNSSENWWKSLSSLSTLPAGTPTV